jgi:predicted acylesterase/phospholipase RssA
MRALVLGGGSALGAFEVGVINNIVSRFKAKWRIFTGISIGAINAGFLAQAKTTEIPSYARGLKALWFDIKNHKNVYRKKITTPFNILWDTGVLDISPLKKLIDQNFDQEKIKRSGNYLRFGAVDTLTGKYFEATEQTPGLKEYMLASAAMPFAFPTQKIGKYNFTDGAIRFPAALDIAIEKECDTIDLVITSPLHYEDRIKPIQNCQMRNGIDLGLRLLRIMHEQTFIMTLLLLQRCNELAQWGDGRYKYKTVNIYAPSNTLDDDLLLTTFEPDNIRRWYNKGLDTEPVRLREYVKDIRLTHKIGE